MITWKCYEKEKTGQYLYFFLKRLKYVAPNQAKGANGTSISHRGCAGISVQEYKSERIYRATWKFT